MVIDSSAWMQRWGWYAYLDVASCVRVFGTSSDCVYVVLVNKQMPPIGGRNKMSHQVMRSYVDPSNEVLLLDVLTVKELMEVDHGSSGEVEIPHAAGRQLGVLSFRNRQVVPCPIGIVKKPLGTHDGLRNTKVNFAVP